MKTVYKLFRRVEGKLRPAIMDEGAGCLYLLYKKGETTYPPEEYPDAWMFAFDTEERLKAYCGDPGDNDVLYECEAENTREARLRVSMSSIYAEGFWDGLYSEYTSPTPHGTIECSSIKPVRRIQC